MFGRKLLVISCMLALIAVLFTFLPSNTDTSTVQQGWQAGRNNTVLFVTNVEKGLSNVHLATTHALAVRHPEIELHYASFRQIEKELKFITDHAAKETPRAAAITFHGIPGLTMTEVYTAMNYSNSNMTLPPGVAGLIKLCGDIQMFAMPWTGPQYLGIYREVQRIIDEVDPAVVVLDVMFSPGLDATRNSNRNHVILTPNTLKDNLAPKQPCGRFLWKYPALSSGYSYPVPWYLVPANIYMNIRLAYHIVFGPHLPAKRKYLKQNGVSNPVDILSLHRPNVLWLSQTLPEADFPLEVVPDNVRAVGPIFLSVAPASEQDAELTSWLGRAPTLLINLGSGFEFDEYLATEMAAAIKEVLSKTNVQVLWKFKNIRRAPFSDAFLSALAPEIASERLRVVPWIAVDPAALMETGHIIASVHHGGAGCYHEAIACGVPQVVLAMWLDLYDFAVRAEMFGVGIWANRRSAPYWTAAELSSAFLKVIGDGDEAVSMRRKAAELRKLARKELGRDVAAREIAAVARSGGAKTW